MGSKKETIDFLLEQLSELEDVRWIKMFGEYGIYCGDKLFALVCDDQFFLKPTEAGKAFLGEVEEGFPYPGAKPWFYIPEDQWDDSEHLVQMVRISLPEIKPVKKKAKKAKD
ncbi:MAG TPA: TfoX/Sxy family protein [Candidatus Cloacimonadota bacterium]|nr:TfoX/Sxy family protein [Candidatus Cloacimonadota bacterium]